MRAGDLGRDVEAKAEPLLVRPDIAARRRAGTGARARRRGSARPHWRPTASNCRAWPRREPGPARRPSRRVSALPSRLENSWATRIRSQLTGSFERKRDIDRALRVDHPQLGDDLIEDRPQRLVAAVQRRSRRRGARARDPARCRSGRTCAGRCSASSRRCVVPSRSAASSAAAARRHRSRRADCAGRDPARR